MSLGRKALILPMVAVAGCATQGEFEEPSINILDVGIDDQAEIKLKASKKRQKLGFMIRAGETVPGLENFKIVAELKTENEWYHHDGRDRDSVKVEGNIGAYLKFGGKGDLQGFVGVKVGGSHKESWKDATIENKTIAEAGVQAALYNKSTKTYITGQALAKFLGDRGYANNIDGKENGYELTLKAVQEIELEGHNFYLVGEGGFFQNFIDREGVYSGINRKIEEEQTSGKAKISVLYHMPGKNQYHLGPYGEVSWVRSDEEGSRNRTREIHDHEFGVEGGIELHEDKVDRFEFGGNVGYKGNAKGGDDEGVVGGAEFRIETKEPFSAIPRLIGKLYDLITGK